MISWQDVMKIKNKVVLKKVREYAKVPFRATPGSAGLDVCAAIEKDIVLKKKHNNKSTKWLCYMFAIRRICGTIDAQKRT